jgi:hypothetical protein
MRYNTINAPKSKRSGDLIQRQKLTSRDSRFAPALVPFVLGPKDPGLEGVAPGTGLRAERQKLEQKEANLSKFSKIAGIATLVAVIGVGILGVAVYAQEPDPDTPFGRMADYFEQVRDLIASKLGVERAALDAAETEAHQEVIEQAIEDGVITQEMADRMLSRLEDGFGFGRMGRMGGRRGHWMGGFKGGLPCNQEWLAEQFGMTVDELQAELEAGKTIDELAEEKGVDLDAARIEAMKERIQQAVEDGTISQEQADWMLQGLEQGFMPGGRGFGFGGRGGHLGGFRGFWGKPTSSDQGGQPNL